MSNPNVALNLDQAVEEVLNLLTGQDLTYDPGYDRYRVIARQINRALRQNALEHEWSYYASTESLGAVVEGVWSVDLPSSVRPRVIGDDAVRLVNADGYVVEWAYFLPRDALHKYVDRQGLRAAVTRSTLLFSRPFRSGEVGLDIQVPVMREPTMYQIPAHPTDPAAPLPVFSAVERAKEVDFDYPDLIIQRAAWLYAQTDPIMQPRVQALEAQYKDLMYQLIERDDRNTDSAELNAWSIPVQNGSTPTYGYGPAHPHADPWR